MNIFISFLILAAPKPPAQNAYNCSSGNWTEVLNNEAISIDPMAPRRT